DLLRRELPHVALQPVARAAAPNRRRALRPTAGSGAMTGTANTAKTGTADKPRAARADQCRPGHPSAALYHLTDLSGGASPERMQAARGVLSFLRGAGARWSATVAVDLASGRPRSSAVPATCAGLRRPSGRASSGERLPPPTDRPSAPRALAPSPAWRCQWPGVEPADRLAPGSGWTGSWRVDPRSRRWPGASCP